MGNAYSFVAEECIQSLYAIKTKNLIELSIAQVSDCCGTKTLQDPFQCIHKKLGGLCRMQDYPKAKGSCDPKSCKPIAPVRL
jgi:hypothetical protein